MSSELASSLQLAIDSLPDSPHDDHDAGRLRILSLAQKLVQKLETPEDRIRRLGYEVSVVFSVIRAIHPTSNHRLGSRRHTPTNSACGWQLTLGSSISWLKI
jgi:hypothetical protein